MSSLHHVAPWAGDPVYSGSFTIPWIFVMDMGSKPQ
jgi:hypothetical protein